MPAFQDDDELFEIEPAKKPKAKAKPAVEAEPHGEGQPKASRWGTAGGGLIVLLIVLKLVFAGIKIHNRDQARAGREQAARQAQWDEIGENLERAARKVRARERLNNAVPEERDAIRALQAMNGRVQLSDQNRVDAVWFPSDAREGNLTLLAVFKSIRELHADNNPTVAGGGVKSISNLTTLEVLNLTGDVGVNDAVVVELKSLSSLKRLGLAGTGVTEAGREQLKAALPNCEIVTTPVPQKP